MSSGNRVSPTATATPARVRLFQPSQRPAHRQGEWQETSFGRCRVTGRIGQRHADLVEAVLFCAEKSRTIEDGGVEVLVDPAAVRKVISDSRYSLEQIKKLFAELRVVVVDIETDALARSGGRLIGGLIDHVVPSSATRIDPLTGEQRNLWRIRLGIALVMLLERDICLYYDPRPLCRLQHGISQAVARHVLTHSHPPRGGWEMDTLIRAVEGDVAGQRLCDARFRLRADAEALAKAGVVVDGDRVRKR